MSLFSLYKKTGLSILFVFHGGAEETRTLYLIAASDALSQVSYDPMCNYDNTDLWKILDNSYRG